VADVDAVDGRYTVSAALMVAAPIDTVRAVIADEARLADWVPHASRLPGPVGDGEIRLGVGATHGPTHFIGRTTVEPDGTVVRTWALHLPRPDATWSRAIRYTTTWVEGGTHLDAEVTTTIPGAGARALRTGGKAEGKGLEAALATLARVIEGRRPRRRSAPEAGPL
jgi:hypothetical protein